MKVTYQVSKFNNYDQILRSQFVKSKKYDPPKWIQFCDLLLEKGYNPKVYCSSISVSKYIYFDSNTGPFKIRFSQHAPKVRDYDVNVGPNGVSYNQLIRLFGITL